MVTLICPWCEHDVAVDMELLGGVLDCPACSTSCLLDEEPREVELALVA
jgi:hypothetical protein